MAKADVTSSGMKQKANFEADSRAPFPLVRYLQEKEPNVEESTFLLNGRPCDFDKLMGLPVLAQRLKAAVPACAESDSAVRKVFILVSEVTDKVYLWHEQVMCSFEELTTAVCGDLHAKVCLAMSR